MNAVVGNFCISCLGRQLYRATVSKDGQWGSQRVKCRVCGQGEDDGHRHTSGESQEVVRGIGGKCESGAGSGAGGVREGGSLRELRDAGQDCFAEPGSSDDKRLRVHIANAEGQGCRASRHTLDPLVGSLDRKGGKMRQRWTSTCCLECLNWIAGKAKCKEDRDQCQRTADVCKGVAKGLHTAPNKCFACPDFKQGGQHGSVSGTGNDVDISDGVLHTGMDGDMVTANHA